MSESLYKRRVIAASLAAGIGTFGIAGCSGKSSNGGEAAANVPPLAVPGEVMQCQTNPGTQPKKLAEALELGPQVAQETSKIFHVPEKEMHDKGLAFLSTCDLSLTGSIVSHYGEIPKMTGDPRAAGKLCIIWQALYLSRAAVETDAPLNSFVIVCDPDKLGGLQPSPSQTTQA